MTIKKFEDIVAWQRARELVNSIYDLALETPLGKDRGLRSQIERAAVSCMSNIAEGFGRDSNLEFRKHLRYTIGSAREVQSCLYVALDRRMINAEAFRAAYELAQEVAAMCESFARHLGRTSRKR